MYSYVYTYIFIDLCTYIYIHLESENTEDDLAIEILEETGKMMITSLINYCTYTHRFTCIYI
jgi:hypothetical protein